MNSKQNSYDRLRQLRDWLRLEFPKIKEAAIERKMGLATNYFKTRERAQKSHGDKQLHAQTIEKIKEAWEEQKRHTTAQYRLARQRNRRNVHRHANRQPDERHSLLR